MTHIRNKFTFGLSCCYRFTGKLISTLNRRLKLFIDLLDFDSDSNTSETTRSFYHRNALGSVMEITDMNEAEVASYRYDPYGAVTITIAGTPQGSDPLGQPWMYTGRFTDEETGLYYYRARHYSAVVGRFLQRDPIGIEGGASLFQYVESSPVNLTDPLGLEPPSTPHPQSPGRSRRNPNGRPSHESKPGRPGVWQMCTSPSSSA